MKNTIMLVAVMTLIGFSVTAQSKTGNDFIVLNNNWNKNQYNYSAHLYYNPQAFRNSRNHEISLQYVRSVNPNRAMRFSLGFNRHYFLGNSTYRNVGDTTYQSYRNYDAFLPKLGFGMEWRKLLHKDVMLTGGADMELGLGSLRQTNWETKTYRDGDDFYQEASGSGNPGSGIGFHAGITPYTGLRVSWGRFALGYTATLPFKLNIAKSNSDRISEANIKFQNSVSVGYRIFNRKKKKK